MKYGLVLLLSTLCLSQPALARSVKPMSGDSVYQLDSPWTNQDGKTLSLAHFEGEPVVLAMIYTSCRDECPLLVLDMQRIEKALSPEARARVQFALFSFDTKRDTPEVLKQYASARGLDPSHWTLWRGPEDSVHQLAAALNVRYKKLRNGDFSHSSVITLLDSKGTIRYQQAGLRKDPHKPAAVLARLLKP